MKREFMHKTIFFDCSSHNLKVIDFKAKLLKDLKEKNIMTNKKLKAAQFDSPLMEDEVHVTLKDIAANCGFGEDIAAEGVAELEAVGLIKKIGKDKYKIMQL